MLLRVSLMLAFAAAKAGYSQVDPSAIGPPVIPDEMQTPHPVSGEPYPNVTISETRSNYLEAGIDIETAYDDNVLANESIAPVHDTDYSIKPAIELDRTTPRIHEAITYSPIFTLYEHTSARNESDQDVLASFSCHLSTHVAMSTRDTLHKSTNILNQPLGVINGSMQFSTEGIVAPFADMLSNEANDGLTYQFKANGMIGADGATTLTHYHNQAIASGLYDSTSRSGSGFCDHRLSVTQYIGEIYQYTWMTASSVNANSITQTHAIYSFYSLILRMTISMSMAAGPQYVIAAQSTLLDIRSWKPAVIASIGWQKRYTNLAASYSRTITGNGGLLGAFNTTNAQANARWQLTRTWTLGSAASYMLSKNVDSVASSSNPGGHSISGTISAEHGIAEHFKAEIGYMRLHQSYRSISVISNRPDSDRAYIALSYVFEKPTGK